MKDRTDRRKFLTGGAAAIAVIAACGKRSKQAPAEEPDEVTPGEDLMREHGILRRVMYIYDEAALGLDDRSTVPLDALGNAAEIIRRVIEDYHEKIEEQHVFPRFEAAGVLTDLVATLRTQHQAGRIVTTRIRDLSRLPLDDGNRRELSRALRGFNHMYRPHAAREDTDLFPALRPLVGPSVYAELGERFEDIEKEQLGARGFERALAEVARLERAFGVGELVKLMPTPAGV